MDSKAYLGDIIGGSIMLRESRIIAQLLLASPDASRWEEAIVSDNCLQKNSQHSAKRMASTVRKRLLPMGAKFWEYLLECSDEAAKQLLLLAVIHQSPVLGDFMTTVVSDARRMYRDALSASDWSDFMLSRQRVVADLDSYSASSIQKIGSNIIKILADTGYLESGRNKKLKNVYLLPEAKAWAIQLSCMKAYEAMESAL
ncbi:MAG: DUF1819 family protein [Shewanella sp.]|uniref:DUF1819 family protein n=1 Tax=Shewanella sp. TaxID=50422 RepID=UPI003F347704